MDLFNGFAPLTVNRDRGPILELGREHREQPAEQFVALMLVDPGHDRTKPWCRNNVHNHLFLWMIVPWGLGKGRGLPMLASMTGLGSRIEESGTLIADEDRLVLRRDLGGRYLLDLHRVDEPIAGERVRLSGVLVEDGLVDVDSIAPEVPA